MSEFNSPKKLSVFQLAAYLLAAIFLTFNLSAWAQDVSTGRIRGTVTDSSGAIVPETSVTVKNELTNRAVQLKTDGNGQYDAVSLLPGMYAITFEKEGFKTLIRSGVKLETSGVVGVNVALQVGSVATKMVVEGFAPLVQTETAAQSQVIEDRALMELPNVTGSEASLLALIPGAAPGQSGQQAGGEASGAGQMSISGSFSNSFDWLMDGGLNKSVGAQVPSPSPVMENVAEFSMQLHDFSAQYGNGSASFNVVTKSGTNNFHGTLYEYVQNNKFNARNFFAQGVPPLRYNRFGGNVGGPIRKDKAFFFFGFTETTTVSYSPFTATVPTAQEKQGDFSGISTTLYDPNSLTYVGGVPTRTPLAGNIVPTIDSVAAKTLAYLPAPNQPGITAGGITNNNFYTAGDSPSKNFAYNGKVDYNFSPRNRLQVSELVTLAKSTSISQPAPGIGEVLSIGHSYFLRGTDVWTINSHMVNEFAASGMRLYNTYKSSDEGKGYPQKLGFTGVPIDAFPYFQIQGAIPFNVGMSPALDVVAENQSDSISDSLTWIKGKNNFKAGIEFDEFFTPYSDLMSGQFTFNGIDTRNPADSTSTGLGMADFLYGASNSWYLGNQPSYNEETRSMQYYFLDDIKLRSNLTVNLGVRFYNPRGWNEQYNRQANFSPTAIDPLSGNPGAVCFAGNPNHYSGCDNSTSWPNSSHEWQPRFGIAWSPKANWAVRGGYGMYSLFRGGLYEGFYPDLGWFVLGSQNTTDYMTPTLYLKNGEPIPPNPASTRTPSIADNAEGGYYMAYQPTKMPWQYLQQYQVDVQHQFSNGVVVDVGYVGTHGNHMPFGHDMNATPPADIHFINDPTVNMENLRPFPQITWVFEASSTGWSNYNSLQVTAKKHFSNGLFFQANYTWQRSLDTGTGGGWTSQMQVDSIQNVSDVAANYANSRGNTPNVLSAAVVYDLPFGHGKALLSQGRVVNAIVGGWQLSSIIQLHSGVPFTPEVGTGDYSGQNALASEWFGQLVGDPHISNPTVQKWFNTSAYAVPQPGTFGNAGRNSLVGPPWKCWDASLARNIKLHWLGDAGALQIRVDTTDLTNYPNFGQPNPWVGTAGLGTITSANTSRVVQLGARLTF